MIAFIIRYLVCSCSEIETIQGSSDTMIVFFGGQIFPILHFKLFFFNKIFILRTGLAPVFWFLPYLVSLRIICVSERFMKTCVLYICVTLVILYLTPIFFIFLYIVHKFCAWKHQKKLPTVSVFHCIFFSLLQQKKLRWRSTAMK